MNRRQLETHNKAQSHKLVVSRTDGREAVFYGDKIDLEAISDCIDSAHGTEITINK